MPAVITVDHLTKSYGPVAALSDISFDVAKGELLAVLGPNGAGKTTTVEILEGYRKRDGGDVRVLGLDPATGGSPMRERIGIVLQENGVEPYLTVSEVLEMVAGYYHAPRQVDEVIALVGLEEKAKSRVKTLSGGQRRRLDLALGLIGDPELLFLDEPTTGFDPSARRQAWDVIRSLRTLGKTILLTTHYMDEAQELADRILVIVGGQIVADGPPDSIGGRETADAQIRFQLPAGVGVEQLPVPPRLVDGREVLIETTTPTEVLHRLTGWAIGMGTELEGLSVARPSLEDVYLELTRSEAKAEGGGR